MTDPAFNGTSEGAELLFSCTATPEEWDALSSIVDERVVRFYGTHPWYHDKIALERLERILDDDPKACVGEIGLDLKRGRLEDQMKIFEEQLVLSKRYDRIANIHMIGCEEEMLKILRKARATCIIHSFSGPVSYIRPLSECGCYFSISPRIHSRSKVKIGALLSSIPEEKLLIETDAPNNRYGMDNHIVMLSSIMGIGTDELTRITLRNASSLIP